MKLQISNSQQAFTMLELLISMTILSVIMVIIMSAFKIGTRSWEVGENRAEKNQRLRIAAVQLTEEIRSAFPYKTKTELEDEDTPKPVMGFFGESDSMKFITSTGGLTPNPVGTQLRAVYYKVNYEGLVVWESFLNFDDFFEDPESVGEEIIIYPDVTDISFEYCYKLKPLGSEEDEVEPDEEIICEDSWDPTDIFTDTEMLVEEDKKPEDRNDYKELPLAVNVTLTLKPETEGDADVALPTLVIPITTTHQINISTDEG